MRANEEALPLEVSRRSGSGPGVAILDVAGDLVITSRNELRAAVEACLAAGEPRVIVGCDRLTHVDMAGFALLYRLHERCAAGGGRLTVAGLAAEFGDVARSLHLDEHLLFTDDVDAALDSLR